MFELISNDYQELKKNFPNYEDKKFDDLCTNKNLILLCGVSAGFVGGLLGIGGGLISTPLLLSLGFSINVKKKKFFSFNYI
jgi:hypothetical protein